MSVIFINPGSGPVAGRPLLSDAWKNVRVFRRDCGLLGVASIARVRKEDSDGRYGFLLRSTEKPRKKCMVWMPGIPIEQVRYRMNTTDNAWHFPRLLTGEYGSSWLWPFAVNSCRCDLGFEDDE